MTIGTLAKQAGLRPSAIRYYERLGVLTPPLRRSGRRDYGPEAVAQLAVVRFATSAGFSLRETKQLVRGFGRDVRASAIWREFASAKIAHLDGVIARATAMKAALERISACTCKTLLDCGRAMARGRCVR